MVTSHHLSKVFAVGIFFGILHQFSFGEVFCPFREMWDRVGSPADSSGQTKSVAEWLHVPRFSKR